METITAPVVGMKVQRKGSKVVWTITSHDNKILPQGQTSGFATVDQGIEGATKIHVTCQPKNRTSTMSDWISIESRVESFKRSSFEVKHNVLKGEALAIEAWETRVLVGKHPDEPNKLKSAPMPQEIIDKFMRG